MEKIALLIVGLMMVPGIASAKPVECSAREGAMSMQLVDHSKEKAEMVFRYGKEEIRCPFKRAKVQDGKTGKDKKDRKVTILYKKAGVCNPKNPSGKASRSEFNLVIEWKGPTRTSAFEDPRRDMGAPCELKDFRFEAFGLSSR